MDPIQTCGLFCTLLGLTSLTSFDGDLGKRTDSLTDKLLPFCWDALLLGAGSTDAVADAVVAGAAAADDLDSRFSRLSRPSTVG